MTDSYEADVLQWSQDQARLLRQYATGQRTNATPDWANIIAEIESVGRTQLSAVRSHLIQALLHDLKCEAWPHSHDVPHWRAEALRARGDAAEALTPAMHQRIDVPALYRKARRYLPATIDGQPPLPVPETGA